MYNNLYDAYLILCDDNGLLPNKIEFNLYLENLKRPELLTQVNLEMLSYRSSDDLTNIDSPFWNLVAGGSEN